MGFFLIIIIIILD